MLDAHSNQERRPISLFVLPFETPVLGGITRTLRVSLPTAFRLRWLACCNYFGSGTIYILLQSDSGVNMTMGIEFCQCPLRSEWLTVVELGAGLV